MSAIWIVVWLALRLSNVFHNLMLSFTRDFMTGQDDFASLPVDVLAHFLRNEIFELLGKPSHKLRSRSDAVRVKCIFFGHFYALTDCLFALPFCVQRSPEPPCALLIHLGARSHSIDRHEEQLLRLDLAEQMLDVVEYLDEHFILADPLRDTIGVVVSAVVDDAIHVQVEAVELGDAVLGDELRDRGIALREPAEELRNT